VSEPQWESIAAWDGKLGYWQLRGYRDGDWIHAEQWLLSDGNNVLRAVFKLPVGTDLLPDAFIDGAPKMDANSWDPESHRIDLEEMEADIRAGYDRFLGAVGVLPTRR